MPVEKAKITFYEVEQCGYFHRGEPAAAFGGVQGMLSDLAEWSSGKQLAATKVYEPADGSDLMPAYLMDITEGDGGWLVTIWNQTPATEGKVAAAVGTSSVGAATVLMNDIPPGGIPGFATYFWFIPSKGVFASIRFQHLVTGQKPMQHYMESFLESASKHVVWTDPADGVDIQLAGYRENPAAPVQDLSPRFRTRLFRKSGLHEMLVRNVDRVRKVLRKTTLKLERGEQLDRWQRVMAWTHIRVPQNRPDMVKLQYELAANLGKEDIEAMIASWSAGHDREWDDYGFKLKGESSKVHWLSYSIARKEFDLNVKRNSLEVVNPQSLLKALHGSRAEILKLLE